MLILRRFLHQKLIFTLPSEPSELLALAGKTIVVQVTDFRRKYNPAASNTQAAASLGVEAAASIRIDREEVAAVRQKSPKN